jgi:hypothetical protein
MECEMAGKSPIDAVNAIHKALDGLAVEEQEKALRAVVTLLGINAESVSADKDNADRGSSGSITKSRGGVTVGRAAVQIGTPAEFFRKKDPRGLIEVLAVAARYRELHESAEAHTKDELEGVFRAARRNAPTNFSRDLMNAKQQQYFNSGREIVLSHYGQSYIDALPDREAAKAIPRPKKRGGIRKSKAKAAR